LKEQVWLVTKTGPCRGAARPVQTYVG